VDLQSPHEQEQPGARQVQAGAGLVSRTWEEQRVVHPGWDDPDPLGVGAVQTDELRGLRGGRGDEPVGVGDDLFLAGQPRGSARRSPSAGE
jgi:hypothetical protein